MDRLDDTVLRSMLGAVCARTRNGPAVIVVRPLTSAAAGGVGVYLYGTSITVYGLRSINEVLRDFQQADA